MVRSERQTRDTVWLRRSLRSHIPAPWQRSFPHTGTMAPIIPTYRHQGNDHSHIPASWQRSFQHTGTKATIIPTYRHQGNDHSHIPAPRQRSFPHTGTKATIIPTYRHQGNGHLQLFNGLPGHEFSHVLQLLCPNDMNSVMFCHSCAQMT